MQASDSTPIMRAIKGAAMGGAVGAVGKAAKPLTKALNAMKKPRGNVSGSVIPPASEVIKMDRSASA